MKIINKQFSSGELFSLFLITVFPIHVWSTFIIFIDAKSILELTKSIWDVLGYAGYAFAFSLLESAVIFILVLGLSYLLPIHWRSTQKLSTAGSLIFIFSLWAMLGQMIHIYSNQLSS
ncbi:hypothetical protein ACFLYP_03115, partial [Chloroflexota bacterium]